LAAHRLPGVAFHPYRYTAGIAPYLGRELDGVRLSVTDPARFCPVRASVTILRTLAEYYGAVRVWRHKGVRTAWFDKLYGGQKTRNALQSRASLDALFASWREESKPFLHERKQALIYPRR
jgi:uncharacterized protein YbbC (DUF1343 family)